MDAGTIFFYMLAGVVVITAAGVALAPNISCISAFALLGTLAGVAGLYLYMGADFVGVAQLLIYVGGILVLILFAVLLTNRIGEMNITSLSAGIMVGAPGGDRGHRAHRARGAANRLGRKLKRWPTPPTVARLGDAFLNEYLMPFEFASLVLLMALVGAMVIARRAAKETGKRAKPIILPQDKETIRIPLPDFSDEPTRIPE